MLTASALSRPTMYTPDWQRSCMPLFSVHMFLVFRFETRIRDELPCKVPAVKQYAWMWRIAEGLAYI